MKFKKGQRVRVKGPVYANGDRVDADADGWDCTVDAKSGISPEYWHLWFNKSLIMAHEWQIRRLIPKKRHHRIGNKCTLPNCPESHDPAPLEHVHHEGWFPTHTIKSPCPVESCSWGKDKAVPEDMTSGRNPGETDASRDKVDNPPGRNNYAKVCESCGKAAYRVAIPPTLSTPKPAPREFWLYRVKPCSEDSVWVAMRKPLRTAVLPNEEIIKVREVLPDDTVSRNPAPRTEENER